MSATNAFETSLLGLIITNANASNVGDATGLRGSSTAGVFWIGLHTADLVEIAGPEGETATAGLNRLTFHRPRYDAEGALVRTAVKTGDQTTNETAYTNYARQDEARDTTQWTVTNDTADNDNVISYPTGGASGATLTHFGLGSATSGAGNLFLSGALNASLAVSAGITPSFAAGALDVTCA